MAGEEATNGVNGNGVAVANEPAKDNSTTMDAPNGNIMEKKKVSFQSLGNSITGNPGPSKKIKEDANDKNTTAEGDEPGSKPLIGGLDEETRKVIQEIGSTQEELDDLTEKCAEEMMQVEKRYTQLKKPLYLKRQEIISKIPNFWLQAMQNNPQLAYLIDEEEQDCLQFLSKIHVEETANEDDMRIGQRPFKIEFHFNPNPYFENEVLVKEFPSNAGEGEGKSDFKIKHTKIEWKTGRDLISKMGKVTIAENPRKRKLEPKSFFAWFVDDSHVDCEEDEIGQCFLNQIWQNPVECFLSEGNDEEESDEEMMEGGDLEHLDEEGALGDEDDSDEGEEEEQDEMAMGDEGGEGEEEEEEDEGDL